MEDLSEVDEQPFRPESVWIGVGWLFVRSPCRHRMIPNPKQHRCSQWTQLFLVTYQWTICTIEWIGELSWSVRVIFRLILKSKRRRRLVLISLKWVSHLQISRSASVRPVWNLVSARIRYSTDRRVWCYHWDQTADLLRYPTDDP